MTVLGTSKSPNVFMLGDSRFVGMKSYDSDDNHFYYAKVGEGYNYFKKTWNTVKNYVTDGDYVVINFGVNDLGNIDRYIELINQISTETNAKIIFMTVNPVDEYTESKHGYSVKNSKIDDFNKRISQETNDNVYIVNTNSYLTKNGFQSPDGVHFSKETYINILEYLNSYLDNFEE